MFTFCSLLGAQSESSASQSILELDGGVKVLIDVGWDETFDVAKLKELEKQVPTLSIILLTHATVSHIAAFAHCCKHFPLFSRIPVYATLPVISLGRTLVQNIYASTPLSATIIPHSALSEASYAYSQTISANQDANILLQPPTSEEIASYFALIHPLKYSQPHQPLPSPFSPPLNGLAITAYNAGHTLGGTIWHIQHGLESIVYAVDWNQARENVLAGAAWLGGAGAGGAEVIEQLRKPTALICSSRGGERHALPGGRAKRDELLLEMIKTSVSQGGIVLIPTDSSARVLELAYLLEHVWRTESKDEDSHLRGAKLYLASRNIGATMRYARSMLEWMDDAIIREFEANAGINQKETGSKAAGDAKGSSDGGPFDFKHLRLLERKGQIDRIMGQTDIDRHGRSIGKVILASDASLEWGFSRDILKAVADDTRNLIILTEKMAKPQGEATSSLAKTLWSWWEDRESVVSEETKSGLVLDRVNSGAKSVAIREAKRLALEGNDLSVYQQWLATQRQLQTTLQSGGATSLENSADVVDDASSDSSSDSEDSETEQQGKSLNISAIGQASRKKIGMSDEDLGINVLLRKKDVYDYDVRGKKGREKMFPLAVRRKRVDDFGELIRPEDFLRAEERDEVNGQDMRNQPNKHDTRDTLGKKRKWEEHSSNGHLIVNEFNKRKQKNRNQRDSPEAGEISPGPEDQQSEDDEDSGDLLAESSPAKVVFTSENLTLNVRIAFVDFAGLHDKRSLQMLLPLIQPRKLILVGGMKDETLALAGDCRKLLKSESTIDVYTPEIGTIVDASVDTNAWAVRLTSALVKQLTWQKVKDLRIATVTARLETIADALNPDDESSNKKQKLLREGDEEESDDTKKDLVSASSAETELPTLDVLPSNMASATRSVAQPLQVGDLRLPDLRKLMLAASHTAEFKGEGTLLIDSTVIVRKTGTGRIEVESIGLATGYGSSFYAVKSMIYQGLAVVNSKPHKLASPEPQVQEHTYTRSLPAGISRIVFKHALLQDPLSSVQLVRFLSIAVYSSFGERIFYIYQVQSLSAGRQGYSTSHGIDPGPPPPASPPSQPSQSRGQLSTPLQALQLQPSNPVRSYPQVALMAGRGHNPAHGYDIGPLPPNFYGTAYPGMPQPRPMAYLPPPSQFPPFQQQILSAWPGPQAYPPYSATYAAPPPISDGGFPGINLRNHFGPNSPTGGVGLPPGYNYIFPSEHTIIHILSVATKPWQLGSSLLPGPHSPLPHTKFYVPVSMNLKEFLGKIGCTEGNGRTDTVFEVSEKGNGGWAKGLTVSMANKDLMKKSVGDLGWRSNRNGNLHKNGQPVVWLWKAEDAPPQ
ncbi:RNA-metabolising metallo-beta-lactamase [Drepanopeziza brunnea f. sp. 'multigermtubi' MB_m1]|uniref:Cleavage and polyadenylation specificity factor subunit 2 n=1 Tax=Marssonina brunnea f. sp. multigermtubi (strain MB_m1) TaxID=1072389 RepID=K1WM91_MARBU|nr:RNA-metabolising metallo-beta-lactamase [Drepanopeziza brunnea f. sp. 'multigermtubi' MB_m1]EKD18815.1 RNA-metabolising metallo-beta-lactamase [Drepanopeziza brunnea f. sp. 'multigermtubi' MB_m1]